MKWNARLRFKACGYRLVRQELDSAGNAVGEPVATPYCPERFLTLVYINDGDGREFQIGTDAIDICAKLPPNTGSGLLIGRGRPFFDDGDGQTFEFREDALSSMRWESEPFEIDGDFRPCDISLAYWTVPGIDGSTYCLVDCDSFQYRHQPLKMNVIDHGYKVLADKVWRTWQQPDQRATSFDAASLSGTLQHFEGGIRICREGERAIDSYTADGLVIFGEGYGDSGRSDLAKRFGIAVGGSGFYDLGLDAQYRYVVYCCDTEDYEKPWIPIEKLLARGARSIVVDYSPVQRIQCAASVQRRLREHGLAFEL